MFWPRPEHRPAATSRRSLPACIAFLPLQSSWMSKTYLKHFNGGGSPVRQSKRQIRLRLRDTRRCSLRRRRQFLHPRLGFTFVAPEGFTLKNIAPTIVGLNEGGEQGLTLNVVRVPAGQSLAYYLSSGWASNPDRIEEISINGLLAATARAKGDHLEFRLYAIRLGTDVYRFIFTSKQINAEIDRAFRESANTFRPMSRAEVECGTGRNFAWEVTKIEAARH